MKTYELTYIISSDITSEQAGAKAKEIESLILQRQGSVLKQLDPTAKALSQPIKGKASGFFGAIEFQIEPEKLLEVKEILEKDGNIARHMVIIKKAAELKKSKRTKAKSAMAQAQEPSAPAETPEQTEEKPAKKPAKEKVELKDIEEKLEELLN